MSKIKLLILDVDGTLTDGKIHCSAKGELFKSFDIKDGFVLRHMMPKAGIVPVVITGRHSDIVDVRMSELDIAEIYQGVFDKTSKLKEIVNSHAIELSECAYIGDDLNDYAAMAMCGFKACPANAISEVKAICDYISPFNGGSGAVRDICEHILRNEEKYVGLLKIYGIEV
jgi:3-deoxy-D-manno-octulosonate 8-phosphate phosphatase (KDO 8-P phosphatase)